MSKIFHFILNLLFIILLIKTICGNSCRNINDGYSDDDDDSNTKFLKIGRQNRKARLFHIENRDSNAVVNIAYEIPFLTIPIKRSITGVQNFASGMMNENYLGKLNLPGLAIGIIGAVSGMFLAGIDTVSQNGALGYNFKRFFNNKNGRLYEHQNDIIGIASELYENTVKNFNTKKTMSCAQKFLCNFVKKSMKNVLNGDATKIDKIIEDLSNSTWSMDLLTGSQFQDAIKNGRNLMNCEEYYTMCQFKAKFK